MKTDDQFLDYWVTKNKHKLDAFAITEYKILATKLKANKAKEDFQIMCAQMSGDYTMKIEQVRARMAAQNNINQQGHI